MKIKYTIKKTPEATLIIKTGMKEEFTLEELNEVIGHNEKIKKECESNLSLREAERKNILEYYPAILDMTDENIFRVAMYYNRNKDVEEYQAKIKQINIKLEEQYAIKKQVDEQ